MHKKAYIQWSSNLASMLFKITDFIPSIKERNFSLITPYFCCTFALSIDMKMICDSESTPGNTSFSWCMLSFLTSWDSFSDTRSHLLHTNKAHLENRICSVPFFLSPWWSPIDSLFDRFSRSTSCEANLNLKGWLFKRNSTSV